MPGDSSDRALSRGPPGPTARAILRLDGHSGTGAVLSDLADLASVMRGQDDHLLERDEVQTRLHLPPDQQITHPESGVVRALDDCPGVPVGAAGLPCRIIVATPPATEKPSRVGSTRAGGVYELCLPVPPRGLYRRRWGGALPASRRV
jgi:hypothetical protein